MNLNNKEIIKEILPSNLTYDSNNNIKMIKRKISIYNLKHETDYKLEDLEIEIIYNRLSKLNSVFYYYKELDKWFNYEKIDIYRENYYKSRNFLITILDNCEVIKSRENEVINVTCLLKDDKVVLKQNFDYKTFYLSNNLIWERVDSNLYSTFEYNWLEKSNLFNSILEEYFNVNGFNSTLLLD